MLEAVATRPTEIRRLASPRLLIFRTPGAKWISVVSRTDRFCLAGGEVILKTPYDDAVKTMYVKRRRLAVGRSCVHVEQGEGERMGREWREMDE
jgi:hypothetical protein